MEKRKSLWSFFISDWKNWIIILIGTLMIGIGLIILGITSYCPSFWAFLLIGFGFLFAIYGAIFGLGLAFDRYKRGQ